MIISILNNSRNAQKSHYPKEDVEKWFAEIGAFLASHADDNDDAKKLYWNFVQAREACYPILYPEGFASLL